MSTEERFEKYIFYSPDGCHYWIGATGTGKHSKRGRFNINGRNQWAHRVAFNLYKGPVPDGKCICHHCDNDACVNPNHLFLGTQVDNINDMLRKGRQNLYGQAKINFAIASEIRVSELNDVDASAKYNVSRSTVYFVRKNKTWKPENHKSN